MRIVTKGRVRAVMALAVVVAIIAVVDGMATLRQQRWNDAITARRVPAGAKELPPQAQFAQAFAEAASGADEPALNRYRALQEEPSVGQAARYNSANLLLRQAIALRAGPQPGQALALIELAKESYRDILRQDPGHWDARYNLERAQRLLPDPEEGANDALPGARSAERAATTMRGFSPGLP